MLVHCFLYCVQIIAYYGQKSNQAGCVDKWLYCEQTIFDYLLKQNV